jgi:phosphoserine/homoserine phosphotransferase
MNIICADMEGIFTPEIWINVSEKTGIEDLRLTTRDIPDYNVLMRKRLSILKANGIKIQDIQAVIAEMQPLDGALSFLNWVRSIVPIIFVSDTYTQFAGPLLAKLGSPTLFCNTLSIDAAGNIVDYLLRQKDGKRMTVLALKSLYYHVLAIGDSYNDITMLKEADCGVLFNPPDSIHKEFNLFQVSYEYDELKAIISQNMPIAS